MNADALATLIIMRNKLSIFDPGVSCFLSAPVKLTDNLVSFQIG